jgi:hypothetical protein
VIDLEYEKIKKVLEEHKKWIEDNSNGKRAKLSNTDLRYADLRYADLSNADLSDANLRYADLRYADLSNADLDFSCFPLWCGSFGIKADDRIVSQLIYHVCRLNIENCSDEIKQFVNSIPLEIKNKFREYRGELKKFEGEPDER